MEKKSESSQDARDLAILLENLVVCDTSSISSVSKKPADDLSISNKIGGPQVQAAKGSSTDGKPFPDYDQLIDLLLRSPDGLPAAPIIEFPDDLSLSI